VGDSSGVLFGFNCIRLFDGKEFLIIVGLKLRSYRLKFISDMGILSC
jgi:hypothetical protein